MDRIPSNTKIDKSHCKVEEGQGVVSTEMHHLAAKKFSDLPYDIKFIIWGLVIRQPRIVQVKAQMEETLQKPEETEPPNYRIKLSIESYHTFESLYVNKESRKISRIHLQIKNHENIISSLGNIVYIRNFERLWSSFRSWFWPQDFSDAARSLKGELLFVENISCLAIDVAPSVYDVKAAQARPSIFPILEVFKDLLELKLVLNLNEYTTPTQKPRQLLVGTTHMLAAAGAGEQFESGWEAAYPAVVKSYNYASMNCTSLKHTLQEGYGVDFLEGAFKPRDRGYVVAHHFANVPNHWNTTALNHGVANAPNHWNAIAPNYLVANAPPASNRKIERIWGISSNGLRLMDPQTWETSSPHPYRARTRNLKMKIAQWKKPQWPSFSREMVLVSR